MQRCGEEAMECPGMDHSEQNKKKRPTHYYSIMR